jgi:lipopolysaccharide/colanic/teichoic acid biosynthesis glycosyltransferase
MAQRVIAALLLALALPVLAVVGLAIALADGRPVLFRQERLGRGKATFEILKLRTMTEGHITRVGGLLRRTGIDEIPQLVNIVRGDMRFIGPRPLTAYDVERLGWGDAGHAARWDVRPGLTGYAQFAPVCDRDLSWRMDREYAERRTAWFDLKLTVATAATLVVGKQRVKGWLG